MKRKDDLFTRVLRTFKDLQETTHILPKATNSHVTPFSPSNLSESHGHAPPVGLHGHQLQFFVLCLGGGSKSSEMQRDDSTCAEQHGKHGPFFSQNDRRQHGRCISFLRLTCHLQPFGLAKHMEEQQDSNEVHVKWRC